MDGGGEGVKGFSWTFLFVSFFSLCFLFFLFVFFVFFFSFFFLCFPFFFPFSFLFFFCPARPLEFSFFLFSEPPKSASTTGIMVTVDGSLLLPNK